MVVYQNQIIFWIHSHFKPYCKSPNEQFITRTKEPTKHTTRAGNARGYHAKVGNSCFNNKVNDYAYYILQSYHNCYYSSSEPVIDE
mmetsp:Transcript_19144/g.24834  ORF Transcript_19144/g.24834 Transcript_19144/m.24834 type:complete len:86 (-) Transcript_19144:60-317(-)